MSSHPVRCHCCVSDTTRSAWNRLSLEVVSTLADILNVRSRNDGNPSVAAQRYTPVTNVSASAPTNLTTAQSPSTDTASIFSIRQSDGIYGLNDSQITATTNQKLQLLFSVQGLQWSLELQSILLPEEPCDSTLFKSLRTFHRLCRPPLLHWLSPFRFKICRCVKVCGFLTEY